MFHMYRFYRQQTETACDGKIATKVLGKILRFVKIILLSWYLGKVLGKNETNFTSSTVYEKRFVSLGRSRF